MRLTAVALTLAFLAACAGSPGEGKPRAEVSEPPPAETPASNEAAAPAEAVASASGLPVPAINASKVVDIDRAASKLGAIGAKITAKHPITFHDFEGRIGLEDDKVTAVAFAAKIATLESDHPKLTEHLIHADFLDAATYPHATFVSTEVKDGSSEAGATHTVTGDLTIRGKTLRVTFPATITVEADKVAARTEFVINRQDFGVTYPGKPDDLVQDDVLLQVDFTAPRG